MNSCYECSYSILIQHLIKAQSGQNKIESGSYPVLDVSDFLSFISGLSTGNDRYGNKCNFVSTLSQYLSHPTVNIDYLPDECFISLFLIF